MTKMARLPFLAYGSVCFADAPIDSKTKIEFAGGFCVGPHCGTQYRNCNAGEVSFYEERPPNRGSCMVIHLHDNFSRLFHRLTLMRFPQGLNYNPIALV